MTPAPIPMDDHTGPCANSPKQTPGGWSAASWRNFPAKQLPDYEDEAKLDQAVAKLKYLPKLVVADEVDLLLDQLKEVAQGKRFLLQGGACAERFLDCNSKLIENQLKVLLQMSLVLTWGAKIPTVRVGRMAGQFGKPRSQPKEVVDGKEIFTFKGDNINSFNPDDRTPDPDRLVQGYFHAAATLNYVRSLLNGRFASLHTVNKWNLDFIQNDDGQNSNKELFEKYGLMVTRMKEALRFMDACGMPTTNELQTVNLFSSHEALVLPYEEALTDSDSRYNHGAHFVWIGDRTRQLDGAHVEYCRGIKNPIGVKVGPSMPVQDLVPLIKKLWPEPEAAPGRITLITRFGSDKVESMLPDFVKAVQEARLPVVWSCDPMHGNTVTTSSGLKTRSFDRVIHELRSTFEIHSRLGSRLNGVHLELTGENVTECTGGIVGLQEQDLKTNYTTYCDPRLNYAQSMEVALLCAEFLNDHHLPGTEQAQE